MRPPHVPGGLSFQCCTHMIHKTTMFSHLSQILYNTPFILNLTAAIILRHDGDGGVPYLPHHRREDVQLAAGDAQGLFQGSCWAQCELHLQFFN